MAQMFTLGVLMLVILSLSLPALANEPIKVGLITPLTGEVSSYGQSVRDAVVLGIDQLNSTGGVNGSQLELIVMDDKGDPTEAANAARRLIDRDQVSIIVGPVITRCVLAVAPIAQSAGVPLMTPTGTGDAITGIGDFIFRAAYKDSFQGQVMARFAKESLGLEQVAIIYDIASDYSTGLMEAFRETFTSLGGTISSVESYSTNDMDFSAQLTSISMRNPDGLFIPDYHPSAGPILMQARQMGIDAKMLGVDGWDSPDLHALAGGYEEDAYIVNHYSTEDQSATTQSFIELYTAKYGSTPDALAALGYDAVLILEEALKVAGSTDAEALKLGLGTAQNIQAATGTINMDPEGTPIKAAVILQMKNQKWVMVDKIEP